MKASSIRSLLSRLPALPLLPAALTGCGNAAADSAGSRLAGSLALRTRWALTAPEQSPL